MGIPAFMPENLTPGEILLLARKRAHLEQVDLARAAHVSKSTISNWENGHGEPTITAWCAIARAARADWMLDLRTLMEPGAREATDRWATQLTLVT